VQKVLDNHDESYLKEYIAVESRISETFRLLNRPFSSVLLESLYKKPIAAICYHFLEAASPLYRVDSPDWMFNYISDVIESNVNFLIRELNLTKSECSFIIN
jgi:hypothetical protein